MKEKVSAFFQNEKLRALAKKIFNRKTVTAAVIVLVAAVALRLAFSLLFEVEGTVTKVDGSKITAVNFFTTKTVDIGVFQTTPSAIQVGDRIEILKNLSGDVISVRDHNRDRMREEGTYQGGASYGRGFNDRGRSRHHFGRR